MNILGKDPQQLIKELAAGHNNVTLVPGATKVVNFQNLAGTVGIDAQADIVPADPTVYYRKKTIQFGKIDLSKHWLNQRLTIPLQANSTSHSILPQLIKRYGLKLSTDDLVLTTVDTSKDIWELPIRVKATSWVFKNTLDNIIVYATDVSTDLQYVIKRPSLTGLAYPSADTTKMQGPLLSYGMHYSVHTGQNEALRNAKVGYKMIVASDDDWAIADLLSDYTGLAWSFKQTGPSLYNAEVVYNGVATNVPSTYSHLDRNSATNFLILKLSGVGDVGGYVAIGYTIEVDP